MPRYKLTIEYDGTPYFGFQAQENNLRTVQETIETAVKRFCGESLRVRVAGRTDTGVHATGQVIHLDLTRDWPADTVRDALNAYLRNDDEPIAVLTSEVVGADFDARYSAKARHYLYRIIDRRGALALDRDRAWHATRPLDVDLMNAAAERLIGTHDFTTFRCARCQAKSPIKTLDRLSVRRDGQLVEVRASARSFLHNQVRSMVGALRSAGEGRISADDVTRVLEARDRKQCPALAPPGGLYLIGVDY